MPVEYVNALDAVAAHSTGYKARIELSVSPYDPFFRGDLSTYLSVTHSAMAQTFQAMLSVGRTDPVRILDLPCGFGRITRGLRAAFPATEIVASDIDRRAVDFCTASFDAIPVYGHPKPEQIPIAGRFDLIWSASLLTRVDERMARRYLAAFRQWLAPRGLLLFSTHGRNAVSRWPDDERSASIRQEFEERGYGFREHPSADGTGTAAMSAALAASLITEYPDLMLVGYYECGLADHHDLVTVLKMDVHHPQNDLLLV